MINVYSKKTIFSHGNHKILHISVVIQFLAPFLFELYNWKLISWTEHIRFNNFNLRTYLKILSQIMQINKPSLYTFEEQYIRFI